MAPEVPAGSLILLTGVNGHVASCTALRLLEKGYRVRGTVRTLNSATIVQTALARYSDRLQIVEVGLDIGKPGVFYAALKDVDAVIHTPSPSHMSAKRTEEQVMYFLLTCCYKPNLTFYV